MALQVIGQTNQDLFEGITRPGRGKAAADAQLIPAHLGQYINARWPPDAEGLPVDTWVSLARVVTHPSAVFDQENALLQLACALSDLPPAATGSPELLTPLSIDVRCSNWRNLNDPRTQKLQIKVSSTSAVPDPLYRMPLYHPGSSRKSQCLAVKSSSPVAADLSSRPKAYIHASSGSHQVGVR